MRVEAESQWLALGREMEVPVAIMRLAGIYGPGRNAFVKLGEGKARRIVKPGQVFSRIHVDDIAGATEMLALRGLGGIFNICDDEPAPPQDVIAHAASLMGVEPPPETPFEEAEMTPMARSFYGDNRRVSNAKLKAAGYELHHPDYRGSLERMWREGSWR
jgi:nucleoside-diphosphate-sugar epimerase